MKWLWYLTGGRPMILIGNAFYDSIGGKAVYKYHDRLGRRWLAESAWAWFRVARL